MTTYLLQETVSDGYVRGWSFILVNGKVPMEPEWSSRPRETLAEAMGWALRGNLGIRCGTASRGLVVIDVDSQKGGSLQALPPLPRTVTVLTGGGGTHLYFRLPKGTVMGNSAGRLAPHVDIRGEGGQVVAAGSTHPLTGAVYEYASGLAPWDIEVATLPLWVIERLASRPAGPPTSRPPTSAQTRSRPAPWFAAPSPEALEQQAVRYLSRLPPAISGQGGHSATYRAAVALVHGFGLEPGIAFRILRDLYNPRCDPPWSDRELLHKVDDAGTKPHRRLFGWLIRPPKRPPPAALPRPVGPPPPWMPRPRPQPSGDR